MWICGAHGPHNKETGLLEEIQLENQYRNPTGNYALWDAVLWEKARFQPGLTLFLNCTCTEAETDEARILSVRAWELTSQTWHTLRALLLPGLLGRQHPRRRGWGGVPARARGRAMSSARTSSRPPPTARRWVTPSWCRCAARTRTSRLPRLAGRTASTARVICGTGSTGSARTTSGGWNWVACGTRSAMPRASATTCSRLPTAHGITSRTARPNARWPRTGRSNGWARCRASARTGAWWATTSSRRTMCGRAATSWTSLPTAAGRWTITIPPACCIPASRPFSILRPVPTGIPYRCLYSRNVDNLLFAGRNISVTHAALSSTRVMGTTALLGQAAGTAAALCVRHGCAPRALSSGERLAELQRTLMEDDCWLPRQAAHSIAVGRVGEAAARRHRRRTPPRRSGTATVPTSNTPGPARRAARSLGRGIHRRLSAARGWCSTATCNCTSACPARIRTARRASARCQDRWSRRSGLEASGRSGQWETVFRETNNYQRVVNVPLAGREVRSLRLVTDETWGGVEARGVRI